MDKWMILASAGVTTLIGFAWLALAMQEHWRQVHGDAGPSEATRATLRTLGVCALIASAALCFTVDRPSMAVLVWILFMAFGAVSVALTLSWKPALLRFLFPTSRP